MLVFEVEDPVPLLEPLTGFELVPPWVPVSFPAPLELELVPLLGCSPLVPMPPWFLSQPTSAKAAQTMRINLFIAVVFFNLCLWFLGSVFQSRGTIRHQPLPHNTVKPCLVFDKEPISPPCAPGLLESRRVSRPSTHLSIHPDLGKKKSLAIFRARVVAICSSVFVRIMMASLSSGKRWMVAENPEVEPP